MEFAAFACSLFQTPLFYWVDFRDWVIIIYFFCLKIEISTFWTYANVIIFIFSLTYLREK
jgi:hypothetical protein